MKQLIFGLIFISQISVSIDALAKSKALKKRTPSSETNQTFVTGPDAEKLFEKAHVESTLVDPSGNFADISWVPTKDGMICIYVASFGKGDGARAPQFKPHYYCVPETGSAN